MLRLGISVLLCLISGTVSAEFFSKSQYSAIQSLGLEILASCSPPDCIVVGLGRSPTPITTFLEAWQPGSAVNLPLSNFRYAPLGYSGREEYVQNSISKQDLPKLFAHFDKHLVGIGAAKRIHVIDYAASGDSLIAAMKYLQSYFVERRLSIEVSGLGFAERERGLRRAQEHAHRVGLLDFDYRVLDEPELIRAFMEQKFDSLAEFDRFNFGEHEVAQRNPAHNEFRSKVNRYVARSRASNWLRGLQGSCQSLFSELKLAK